MARQLVNERIQEARDKLPASITPALGPISGPAWGRIYLWTEAKDGAKKPDGSPYTATDLREIQDWIIKPQLRNVPGVTGNQLHWRLCQEYQIAPIPERLASLGVTLQDTIWRWTATTAMWALGYIEKRGEQYLIRAPGQVKSLEDIGNVILSSVNGVPVRFATWRGGHWPGTAHRCSNRQRARSGPRHGVHADRREQPDCLAGGGQEDVGSQQAASQRACMR